MSTRSNIGIIHKDGTVTMNYCHSDGYPSHNGKLLLEHYMDLEKIQQLMDLGDLSFLGPNIGVKHSFDAYPQDYTMCLAYGRDREEVDTAARDLNSIQGAVASMEEYLYLWDTRKPRAKNKWIYSDHGAEFKPLTMKRCERSDF